jgi:hypothetical protein
VEVCHQEREMEHFGVTMAKPLWSHAQEIGRKKKGKKLNYMSYNLFCVQIFNNGNLLTSFDQHAELPMSDISQMYVQRDVTITRIDFWCTD